MDCRLVAWARAVKARRGRRAPPPLFLFTDPALMPDLERVVASLPRGLCGVVFRHDGVAGRPALLRRVARQCRERRLALVVAGDFTGAPPWAGRHLRRGRGIRTQGLRTSSAHGAAELVRARRARATLAFLSPAFPTRSHRDARPLGPVLWARLAWRARLPVYALGGVGGDNVRLLGRAASGAGAIRALLATPCARGITRGSIA